MAAGPTSACRGGRKSPRLRFAPSARFWESRFPVIKPLKRGGGRRYYRPEDVQLLRRIRDLLYKDGYTIRGVQKLLREQARGGLAADDAVDALPLIAGLSTPAPQTVRPAPTQPAPLPPTLRAAAPATPAATKSSPPPVSPEEPPAASGIPVVGITGARRAMLESLLGEIDALRAQLADALNRKGPGEN